MHTLKLLNRHALLFLPLVGITFLAISGGLLTEYGLNNLFKDDIDRPWYLFIFSARLQTQVYATALMGLVWTMFVLIEEFEADRSNRRPVASAGELAWPGIAVLALIQLAAAILNILWVAAGPRPDSGDVAASILLSAAGLLIGIVVVWLMIAGALALARWLDLHQLHVVLGLSVIALTAAGFSLFLVPLMSIFITLGFLVILYCLFELAQTHYRFILVVAILAVLIVGASPEFKYQFPGLEAHYQTPRAERASLIEPARERGQAKAELVAPIAALDAWRARQRQGGGSAPKLVVVTASGGGYRATFWTAIVLDRLAGLEASALPGFAGSVRLMTGASGGMVATAYFAAQRTEAGGAGVQAAIERDINAVRGFYSNTKRDSLTAVIQKLSQKDTPFTFLPLANSDDRGRALEHQWKAIAARFVDLAPGERAGWRPSLILSPMLIDAGRPLFISNLDLAAVVGAQGQAVELFKLFPDAHATFRMATAVRMSATFPYITPAVSLPTREPQRVVDAGYFDNSGLGAAAAFLREPQIAGWIRRNTSGVILIEIDAFDPTLDVAREPYGDPWCREAPPARDAAAMATTSLLDAIPRSLQWLTSPLEGVAAARSAGSQYYNQQLMRALDALYRRESGGSLLTAIQLRNSARASLSWHLPEWEVACLEKEIASPANKAQIDRLVAAWKAK